MEFKNSKSFQNVQTSFVNEATAIIGYLIYADIALAEGKNEAAELFKRMAKNETEHAKAWFKYLHDKPGDTLANLHHAAETENSEWKISYPQAAQKAQEEGFWELAALFERISSIECDHDRRFMEMLLAEGESVKKPATPAHKETKCVCLFCGYPSDTIQEACPVCNALGSFVFDKN